MAQRPLFSPKPGRRQGSCWLKTGFFSCLCTHHGISDLLHSFCEIRVKIIPFFTKNTALDLLDLKICKAYWNLHWGGSQSITQLGHQCRQPCLLSLLAPIIFHLSILDPSQGCLDEFCDQESEYFCLPCCLYWCLCFVFQVKTIQVQKIRYVWNIYAKQFQKVGWVHCTGCTSFSGSQASLWIVS